jgi:hypothetical protein
MRICLAGNDHVWRLVQSEKMRVHLADTMKGNTPQKLILAMMAGHPYRLVSYFYARALPDPGPQLRQLVGGQDRNLVMDSGLYSFMFGSEQGKMPTTYEAYRDYTRRYLDDIDKWGVDCFLVEADTQRLLGMEATLRLREEFKSLGSRVMYVWHQPEGLDGLVKLAQEKDYICLSIPELRMIASGGKTAMGHPAKVSSLCNDLLRRVHKACGDSPPRIHLLGCTVMDMMETQLAWSCDSTSWLSGIRFGNGVIWTPEGLQSCGVRSPRFERFKQMACDAHPLAVDYARQQSNPDYYLNCLACAHAYALYQRHLDASYSAVQMRGDALPEGPRHDPAASTQGKDRRRSVRGADRLA